MNGDQVNNRAVIPPADCTCTLRYGTDEITVRSCRTNADDEQVVFRAITGALRALGITAPAGIAGSDTAVTTDAAEATVRELTEKIAALSAENDRLRQTLDIYQPRGAALTAAARAALMEADNNARARRGQPAMYGNILGVIEQYAARAHAQDNVVVVNGVVAE